MAGEYMKEKDMAQIKPVPDSPANPVLAEKMRAIETALTQIDRQ